MLLFGVVMAKVGVYCTVQQVRIAQGRIEPRGWPYLQTDNVAAQYTFAGFMAVLSIAVVIIAVMS